MKVLEKNDEIILSVSEYKALIERIEDLEDIITYYETKNDPTGPWREVRKKLGFDV